MNQKNYDVDSNNLLFQEEVNEGELFCKKNYSDIRYDDNSKRRRRINILLGMAIALILVSIICAFGGFYYLSDEYVNTKQGETKVTQPLLVSHSNNNFGGVITSFEEYDSLDTAYVYSFTVANSNAMNINYSVNILPIDINNVDVSLINYSIIKNNEELVSGVLTNSSVDTTIGDSSLDIYSIKLWSSKLNNDINFRFRVSVEV